MTGKARWVRAGLVAVATAVFAVATVAVPTIVAERTRDDVRRRGHVLLRSLGALVAAGRDSAARGLAESSPQLVYVAVVDASGRTNVLAYDGSAGVVPPIDTAAPVLGRSSHGVWHESAIAADRRIAVGLSLAPVVAARATARWSVLAGGLGMLAVALGVVAWYRRRWRPAAQRAIRESEALATSLDAQASRAVARADDAVAALDTSCRAVQGISTSARDLAGRAAEVLKQAEATNHGSYSVVDHLINLSEVSENVGDLLEQISRLANKTDLLALNASLEATRAGEHGRGFALVAAEMRRLAAEVGGAARQIAQLMDEIHTATQTVAVASNESAMSSDDTASSARDIADITRGQREATEQALQTLEHLSKVVRDSLSREPSRGSA